MEARYRWSLRARPKQLEPPGDWVTWLLNAGRGYGKTRTGAETIRGWVESGRCRRIALVGKTAADVRDVMVEGESGILAVSPPWFMPRYEPSKRRLTWPNGAMATTYSAEEPDSLRGPQHDGAWCDELGAWKRAQDTWDNLQFGLRLGADPRCIVTTTPRPIQIIRDLIADPTTHVTVGSTYENLANLAPSFRRKVLAKYEGTRLGRQELLAEVLDDVEGALWHLAWIENNRVLKVPELGRIVVAVDPAATANAASDYTGIVVAARGLDGEYYVLHAEQVKLSPHGWGTRTLDLYDQYQADRILAEVNNGGDMVVSTLRGIRPSAPVSTIRATRGKHLRAEPVASLYEQGRVHHCEVFKELEEQQCSFPVANDHDDVLDAAVYAITELSEGAGSVEVVWLGGGAQEDSDDDY